MLLEKVPGGSGSVGEGIVLLEHVMLVTAKIGLNVKSKDAMDIPHSRDAITSIWANIMKDNRSVFMIDPDGFGHPMSLSPSHMHMRNVHLLFTRPELCHPPSKHRTDFHLRRGLFSIADSASVDELSFCWRRFVRIGPRAGRRQWILLEAKR